VSRLITRIETELTPESLTALQPVRMKNKLADIYLQFANSEPALVAYLGMEAAIKGGSLSVRDSEAIKLWVSQQTNCEFCLSVHSFKAKHAGLELELQQAIRRDEATGDEKLDFLLELVSTLFKQPGPISDALLEGAGHHGFTDENLVDITMVMSTIFFTNITNHINDSKSTLPPAPDI